MACAHHMRNENTAVSPRTILLISYHFHPSMESCARRPTALAQFLVSKGVRVVVVCAFEGTEAEPGAEVLPGMTAVPVRPPQSTLIEALVYLKRSTAREPGRSASRGDSDGTTRGQARPRFASRCRDWFFRVIYFVDEYKKWGWRASQAAIRAGRQYEARLVFASSPPDTVLLAGALTARRLAIPYVADLRDPWTDSVAQSYPQRRVELKLLRLLERWVMQSATAITSTGANVAEALARQYRGVRQKIHVVRNGYDGNYHRASTDTGGRLAILFAGELYAGRDPFPLLLALEHLLTRPDVDASRVSVTFMGKAASYGGQNVAEWLRDKRCAANFTILPQQTPAAVLKAIDASTVLLNLAQQQHSSVPAKTYEHLASGRENLLICENDSETAHVVAGIRGVNQADPRDPRALEDVILDLYQRHVIEGRLTAPSEEDVVKFSRAAANEQSWVLMDSLAGLRDPQR